MAETGAVTFKILINEMIADTNIDIVKERDTNDILNYRDYVVVMKGHKDGGRHDHLLVSLQSYDEFMDGYGPIMGFQIFKLSNLDNSLARPTPLPSSTGQTLLSIICHRNVIGIATAVITLFALMNIAVHKLQQIWEATGTEEQNKLSARAKRFCRRFSLAELQSGTRNFSDSHIIGEGGLGRVNKGIIDNGAIKEQAQKEREELDKMLDKMIQENPRRVEEAQRRDAVELQQKLEERLRELEVILSSTGTNAMGQVDWVLDGLKRQKKDRARKTEPNEAGHREQADWILNGLKRQKKDRARRTGPNEPGYRDWILDDLKRQKKDRARKTGPNETGHREQADWILDGLKRQKKDRARKTGPNDPGHRDWILDGLKRQKKDRARKTRPNEANHREQADWVLDYMRQIHLFLLK